MRIESSYKGGTDAQGDAIVTVESPAEIAAALMAEWGGAVERDREWLKVVVGGRYLLWSPEQVDAIVDSLLGVERRTMPQRITIWQAVQFLSEVSDAARKLGGPRLAPEWMRIADLWRRVSFAAWGCSYEEKRLVVRKIAREAAATSRFYARRGEELAGGRFPATSTFCGRLGLYWRACALVLFAASRVGGAS